jgi:hypothetical protein
MHNSISWFKENFEGSVGNPVFFHHSNLLAEDAYMDEAFWVIQPSSLKKLKENVEGFYRSLDWNDLSEKTIKENLIRFNLGEQNFIKEYLVRGEKTKIK